MLLTNILSFIIFPITTLLGSRIEKRDDVINITDSNVLKGISAVFVIFAHFYNQLSMGTDIGVGKLWLNMGGIGVLIFFFLSGYGLNKSRSFERNDFITRRLKSVLLPFLIIRIFCFFINYSFPERGIAFFMGYIMGMFNPQWFISVILIIYAGYFGCYKIFGRRWLNITVLLYNIGIGILFYVLGTNARWFNAHLLFSIGMLVADYNEKIIYSLRKINWWIANIILGGTFLGASIVFSQNKQYIWSIGFKLVSGTAMCLLLINILLRIRMNSIVLQRIGQNSLLIYLIHLQILSMPFMSRVEDDWYLLTGIMVTFLCVFCYNLLKRGLLYCGNRYLVKRV